MAIKSPFISMGPSPSPNLNSSVNIPIIKDSLEDITKSSARGSVGTHYK